MRTFDLHAACARYPPSASSWIGDSTAVRARVGPGEVRAGVKGKDSAKCRASTRTFDVGAVG
jgi:hypothetical protein